MQRSGLHLCGKELGKPAARLLILALLLPVYIPFLTDMIFGDFTDLGWSNSWGNAIAAWSAILSLPGYWGLWLTYRVIRKMPVFACVVAILFGFPVVQPLLVLIEYRFRPLTTSQEWALGDFWRYTGAHYVLLSYAVFLIVVAIVVTRDVNRAQQRSVS